MSPVVCWRCFSTMADSPWSDKRIRLREAALGSVIGFLGNYSWWIGCKKRCTYTGILLQSWRATGSTWKTGFCHQFWFFSRFGNVGFGENFCWLTHPQTSFAKPGWPVKKPTSAFSPVADRWGTFPSWCPTSSSGAPTAPPVPRRGWACLNLQAWLVPGKILPCLPPGPQRRPPPALPPRSPVPGRAGWGRHWCGVGAAYCSGWPCCWAAGLSWAVGWSSQGLRGSGPASPSGMPAVRARWASTWRRAAPVGWCSTSMTRASATSWNSSSPRVGGCSSASPSSVLSPPLSCLILPSMITSGTLWSFAATSRTPHWSSTGLRQSGWRWNPSGGTWLCSVAYS